jgi:MoxR-like ATPase
VSEEEVTRPNGATEQEAVRQLYERLNAAVGRVLIGKEEQVRLVLIALLAEGHVLIDDVPGVAKTLLVRTLAAALGLRFARIQCTPDLLPADVTGSLVFDQTTQSFTFRPGPIFANLLLVDEINRATPRTQAAFLEAMEERHVTVEGQSHMLPQPFIVMATQNPVELKGTFPLPEAQLDRFLLRMRMGYPSHAEEVAILERFRVDDPLRQIAPVVSEADVRASALAVHSVHVSADVERYIARLVRATRESALVTLGASPRAALALLHAAQAAAALDGRDYVIPDDVAALVTPVLAHRLVLSREALARHLDGLAVVAEIVGAVPVPVEERAAG